MNPNQILQRGGGVVLDGARLAGRLSWNVASGTFGIVQGARRGRPAPKPEMDDVTLARKVETEIFRNTRTLKASVNVNVVDGVVWLRGEVKRPQQIRSLEEKTRAVPEVRDIENLLHLTKTPAPSRADTPKRQQRTRSSTRRPTPRRAQGKVSDDRTDALVAKREPSPVEHAERHEGREPAPVGARETSTPETSTPETSTPEPRTPEPRTPEPRTPETSAPETSASETSGEGAGPAAESASPTA